MVWKCSLANRQLGSTKLNYITKCTLYFSSCVLDDEPGLTYYKYALKSILAHSLLVCMSSEGR